MKKVFVEVLNLKTNAVFKKYFTTEFERDKFVRRSKFFKNIKVFVPKEWELVR